VIREARATPERPSSSESQADPERPVFTDEFLARFGSALGGITRLASLKRGWNSYNAPPIDRGALENSTLLLRTLHFHFAQVPEPVIGPSPSGNVFFRWDLPGAEISAEVGAIDYQFIVANPDSDEILAERSTPELGMVAAFLGPYLRTAAANR
jgi:hypothetical protein